MTVIIKKIVPATSLTTIITGYGVVVPNGVNQVVKRAVFSNTGTVPRQITVNAVPAGGSATVANQIINARTLQAGETYVSPELAGYELLPGDQLFMSASANVDVNVTINGIQVS